MYIVLSLITDWRSWIILRKRLEWSTMIWVIFDEFNSLYWLIVVIVASILWFNSEHCDTTIVILYIDIFISKLIPMWSFDVFPLTTKILGYGNLLDVRRTLWLFNTNLCRTMTAIQLITLLTNSLFSSTLNPIYPWTVHIFQRRTYCKYRYRIIKLNTRTMKELRSPQPQSKILTTNSIEPWSKSR